MRDARVGISCRPLDAWIRVDRQPKCELHHRRPRQEYAGTLLPRCGETAFATGAEYQWPYLPDSWRKRRAGRELCILKDGFRRLRDLVQTSADGYANQGHE